MQSQHRTIIYFNLLWIWPIPRQIKVFQFDLVKLGGWWKFCADTLPSSSMPQSHFNLTVTMGIQERTAHHWPTNKPVSRRDQMYHRFPPIVYNVPNSSSISWPYEIPICVAALRGPESLRRCHQNVSWAKPNYRSADQQGGTHVKCEQQLYFTSTSHRL